MGIGNHIVTRKEFAVPHYHTRGMMVVTDYLGHATTHKHLAAIALNSTY